MASPKSLCWTGKKQYLNWSQAQAELKSFKKRRAGATRRAGRRLEVYQCTECRAFHVGNSILGPTSRETEVRLRQIKASRDQQSAKARLRLGDCQSYQNRNHKFDKLIALLSEDDFVN